MNQPSIIEAVMRRDRIVVIACLALVTILAWAWTLTGASTMITSSGDMGDMIGSMAMTIATWSSPHAILIFLMWWIMMTAMMLPSAVPLALLVIALHRRNDRNAWPTLTAGALTAGYVAVWGAFSLCATAAQWSLEISGLLIPQAMAAGPLLAGAILLGAGLYQITPIKRACLTRCRSPVSLIAAHWRPGAAGAFQIGLLHGGFCVGCCWFLMGLLFIGGVMNPFWIGGIALYVLLEKLTPYGVRLSRASGLVLLGSGIAMLAWAV